MMGENGGDVQPSESDIKKDSKTEAYKTGEIMRRLFDPEHIKRVVEGAKTEKELQEKLYGKPGSKEEDAVRRAMENAKRAENSLEILELSPKIKEAIVKIFTSGEYQRIKDGVEFIKKKFGNKPLAALTLYDLAESLIKKSPLEAGRKFTDQENKSMELLQEMRSNIKGDKANLKKADNEIEEAFKRLN